MNPFCGKSIGLACAAIAMFLLAGEPCSVSALGADEENDDRAIVIHAAGALEVSVPLLWHVAEVVSGREIRVVLTPEEMAADQKDPTGGIWFCYHYRPEMNLPDGEFPALLAERLQLTTPEAETTDRPEWILVDDFAAVRQEFSLPPSAADPEEAKDGVIGWHTLVRTRWGLVEIHATSPLSSIEEHREIWAATISTIRLGPPQLDEAMPEPQIADATPVLGSWKGVGSRIQWTSEGLVEMTFDGRGVYLLEFEGSDPPERTTRLTGHFEARDDLLFVTWDDESRLNLRWRIAGDHLLLTDHNGEVSALRRLLQ